METKSIEEFLILAKLGSSYAAAEQLFISQSSLVRHIQALEEEMGMPLFDRTRRGFTLNANGQTFLPFAEKIALTQKQCFLALHPESGEKRRIRMASQCKIVDLLIDFKKAYPDVVIDYQRGHDDEEALREGRLDIAFLSNIRGTQKDLTAVPFYRQEVLVLVPENHSLAVRESVRLEELQQENFVALCDDVVFDEMYLDMYRRMGSVGRIVATAPVGTDILRMVSEGIGIALMHGVRASTPAYPGIRILSLEPGIEFDVCLCYRADLPLSAAAQIFVDFAKKWQIRHKHINTSFDR